MLTILVLKVIHVLGAVLFLGTGLGSAYYKYRATATRNVHVVAWVDQEIVRADWIMTVPSGVIVPVTGLLMVYLYGISIFESWVFLGISGYLLAGITWLPAAKLQIVMRTISAECLAKNEPLPESYFTAQKRWFLLGFPSFSATLIAVWAMVFKSLWPW